MSYAPKPNELHGHVSRLRSLEAYLRQMAGNVNLGGAENELLTAACFIGMAVDAVRGKAPAEKTDWLDG